MRALKFRVWNKKREAMAFVSAMFLSELEYKTAVEIHYPFNHKIEKTQEIVNLSEVELMQYIGLKDKKGKEIYEGDIVADILDGEILMVGDIQFNFGTFGVEWVDCKKNKSMVGAWGQKHNLRRLDDDIVDRIEVIGNIFQNPELLGDLK